MSHPNRKLQDPQASAYHRQLDVAAEYRINPQQKTT